jgi:hypothetical protein
MFVDSDAAATLSNCDITDVHATSNQLDSVSDALGGVVLVANNAFATLSACTITRTSVAATRGHALGGVMCVLGELSQGTLAHCTIVGAGATSMFGNAQGSVVGLGRAAAATIEGCDISHAVATSAFGDADGGVMHLSASATATLGNSSVSHAVAISTEGSARGGVMSLSDGANAWLTNCRIFNVTASSRNDALGGCLMLRNAFVRLVGTQLQSCVAQSEARLGEGGAAYVFSAAQLIMSSGTLLQNNQASTSGHTIKLIAAIAAYALPAPPGRWVPASRCLVYRAACDPSDELHELCVLAESSCRLLTGVQPVAPTAHGEVTCTPRLGERFQRCEYNNPELLDRLIETLPEGAVDIDYPYECTMPGLDVRPLLAACHGLR